MDETSQKLQGVSGNSFVDRQELIQMVEALSASSRRARQNAAQALSLLAKEHINVLVPYTSDIIDALNRPEAQTRWECLDILTLLVDVCPRACDRAIVGAETALFDAESGPLRLSAMQFLCKIGATTENRSEKVWPLIEEALQCYHGDFEFQDMLVAVIDFSAGRLSWRVKEELALRVAFDAANSKGVLKRRAQQILDNVQPH